MDVLMLWGGATWITCHCIGNKWLYKLLFLVTRPFLKIIWPARQLIWNKNIMYRLMAKNEKPHQPHLHWFPMNLLVFFKLGLRNKGVINGKEVGQVITDPNRKWHCSPVTIPRGTLERMKWMRCIRKRTLLTEKAEKERDRIWDKNKC